MSLDNLDDKISSTPENISKDLTDKAANDGQQVFLQLEKISIENEKLKDDNLSRKKLILWVTWVISTWLVVVLIVVTVASFVQTKLSDPVFIALLSTTTLNVIGLGSIVLRGLFVTKKN